MLTWQEKVFEHVNVQIFLFEKQASRTNYPTHVTTFVNLLILKVTICSSTVLLDLTHSKFLREYKGYCMLDTREGSNTYVVVSPIHCYKMKNIKRKLLVNNEEVNSQNNSPANNNYKFWTKWKHSHIHNYLKAWRMTISRQKLDKP